MVQENCLAMSGMFSYKMPNSLVFFRPEANKLNCELLLLLLFLHSKDLECFKNAESMRVIDKKKQECKDILCWRNLNYFCKTK